MDFEMSKASSTLVVIAVTSCAWAPLAHANEVTDVLIAEFAAVCLASDVGEDRYDALSTANGWEPLDPAATNDPNVTASYVKLLQAQPIISSFGFSEGEVTPFCSIQSMSGDVGKLTAWVAEELLGSNPQVVPGMVVKTIYEVNVETAPNVSTVTVQSAFGIVSLIGSQ
ncbi:hypothetical protein PEL8287_01834 [Roseovarius litorisediminis]|uniref:Uncharacterized protein n=1 Tax=Roseovarius litorisediminis TaxID=1312363 RepID=A0A1Y5SHP1_9RHOB|nr:hypothetical protein [Roseovarius litorisediminis]SLN37877.1 hypothetical protein PEL8287_01834 [Roseovarius litorisediminis]